LLPRGKVLGGQVGFGKSKEALPLESEKLQHPGGGAKRKIGGVTRSTIKTQTEGGTFLTAKEPGGGTPSTFTGAAPACQGEGNVGKKR